MSTGSAHVGPVSQAETHTGRRRRALCGISIRKMVLISLCDILSLFPKQYCYKLETKGTPSDPGHCFH